MKIDQVCALLAIIFMLWVLALMTVQSKDVIKTVKISTSSGKCVSAEEWGRDENGDSYKLNIPCEKVNGSFERVFVQ